jgi:hypothetical protein
MTPTNAKPRPRGKRLTPQEIETIKEGFVSRKKAAKIARLIGCSPGVVLKYYARFRDQGVRRAGLPAPTQPAPAAPKSRFYKSDFIPS